MDSSWKDLFPFKFTLVENGLLISYANSYLIGLVEKTHFRQGIVALPSICIHLLETEYTLVNCP